ncbi:MAG: TIGR03792 family protein [Actinomycetota bacterium]
MSTAVELLRFAVPTHERDEWVEVETGVWTDFLRRCPGFLAKEVWAPVDGDDVLVVIWWSSLGEWKAITPEQCAEVDERMGEWLRPLSEAHELELVRRFDGPIDESAPGTP